MRRMIPSNKTKVLDNIAVNDNGTVVEIGGNVAIESIEQFGHLVDKEVIVEISGSLEPTGPLLTDLVVVTGIKEILEGWSAGGPPAESVPCNNGEMFWSSNFFMMLIKLNDTIYAQVGKQGDNWYSKVKGDNLTYSNEWPAKEEQQFVTDISPEKDFKPFFTEEQYEALIDLIENN